MNINKDNFTNVTTPEFLILEVIDNQIEHLKNEVARLEKLKRDIRYELECGNGWSTNIYQILQR